MAIFQSQSLPYIPTNAPVEQQVAAMNRVIDQINASQRTQILNDGTSDRYLYGYQKGGWPGGDFGMKISLPGVDVATATTAQLLFSWDFTTNTQRWYDQSSGKNYMQIGLLPNGVNGFVTATPGTNVSEIFA